MDMLDVPDAAIESPMLHHIGTRDIIMIVTEETSSAAGPSASMQSMHGCLKHNAFLTTDE